MPHEYDFRYAALVKENARLRRELRAAEERLPDGAGWCEECEYPDMADELSGRLNRERREHSAAMDSAERDRQELAWELDSCRDTAAKCRMKNRQLIRGY